MDQVIKNRVEHVPLSQIFERKWETELSYKAKEQGALTQKLPSGEVALGEAVRINWPEGVEILLAAGANPKQLMSSGETALEYAIKNDFGHIAELLEEAQLEKGVRKIY